MLDGANPPFKQKGDSLVRAPNSCVKWDWSVNPISKASPAQSVGAVLTRATAVARRRLVRAHCLGLKHRHAIRLGQDNFWDSVLRSLRLVSSLRTNLIGKSYTNAKF